MGRRAVRTRLIGRVIERLFVGGGRGLWGDSMELIGRWDCGFKSALGFLCNDELLIHVQFD